MKGAADNALGIYISVPFCRSKCTYCNFASGVYPAADHARYVERAIEDLSGAGTWAAALGVELPRRVDTVYLGGGTPSLLEPELLARLFAAMRAEFDLDAGAEITMECAPGQLTGATLEAMAAAGVNRASLGVQSFVDSEAHASGRLHNRATVETDLAQLRAAGIANLNVDLIAGLAGQTFASWEESLEALIGSGVPHASIYMLEIDGDSRLGREVLKGGSRYHAGLVPGDDAIARMYEQAIERLAQSGLQQYEISNFARPGFESRHNLRYWQRRPYLGVGLDASSMLRCKPTFAAKEETRQKWDTRPLHGADHSMHRNGPDDMLRATTTDDLKAYLAGAEMVETTWLTPARQHEEAWFLGLRLNAGVNVVALEREFGRAMVDPAVEIVARLVSDGLLTFDGGRVRLTARGRLISNDVFQEFLEPEVAAACHER
ncbi:MAG: radical SAM family heme chaperone HemW [Terracidiphilus sp.]|jgi:oxygen-independent coproporphyrinogen-3 oxidase